MNTNYSNNLQLNSSKSPIILILINRKAKRNIFRDFCLFSLLLKTPSLDLNNIFQVTLHLNISNPTIYLIGNDGASDYLSPKNPSEYNLLSKNSVVQPSEGAYTLYNSFNGLWLLISSKIAGLVFGDNSQATRAPSFPRIWPGNPAHRV